MKRAVAVQDLGFDITPAAACAEAEIYSSHALKKAKALLTMQRAGFGFRDAKRAFKRAQWGDIIGGGGGRACVGCHLHETAQQTLYLTTGVMGE